jgi:hypothetical protein
VGAPAHTWKPRSAIAAFYFLPNNAPSACRCQNTAKWHRHLALHRSPKEWRLRRIPRLRSMVSPARRQRARRSRAPLHEYPIEERDHLRRWRERALKRRDLAAFPQTAMSHQRRRPAFEVSMNSHEQLGPRQMRSRSFGNGKICSTIR